MTSDTLTVLAALAGARLKKGGHMLAAAESCTGGWVASSIVSIAGSSDWFDRGFVTYSNAAKREMLGVPATTIDEHGAVSEPVARAMAEGAIAHSAASVSLSITGVAGPTGGSPSKPVGTVCFAWARRGGATDAVTRHFEGDRTEVRRQSVIFALQGLIERLEGN